jgi:hypothetical protein
MNPTIGLLVIETRKKLSMPSSAVITLFNGLPFLLRRATRAERSPRRRRKIEKRKIEKRKRKRRRRGSDKDDMGSEVVFLPSKSC